MKNNGILFQFRMAIEFVVKTMLFITITYPGNGINIDNIQIG